MIPLRLWTLCSALTQALKLMAADGEAVSCSLKKKDPLYEDVPMSEEKEDEGERGASSRPPLKPPDDSKDSSIETDRDVSSGEDSDSVEAMTTAFWKGRFYQIKNELPRLLTLLRHLTHPYFQ